ncbi:MAG: class II aldolase/adducin family protein [Caldilineales bacterium]
MLTPPYPELDDLLHTMGEAGRHLAEIEASEGAAGNISVCLRWQPETIVNLPEGIGFIPFAVPGSAELMAGNVAALRRCRIVIWAKHGVMARSDISVKRAADRVEYAETAAKSEYLNLRVGEIGTGLTPDEIRAICATFDIQQEIF